MKESPNLFRLKSSSHAKLSNSLKFIIQQKQKYATVSDSFQLISKQCVEFALNRNDKVNVT